MEHVRSTREPLVIPKRGNVAKLISADNENDNFF